MSAIVMLRQSRFPDCTDRSTISLIGFIHGPFRTRFQSFSASQTIPPFPYAFRSAES